MKTVTKRLPPKVATLQAADKPKESHLDTMIGEFRIHCPAGQFWHVTFRGQHMYSNMRRYKAVQWAKSLNKAYGNLYA